MNTVFVNPERCIGCLQCEFACAVEHSSSKDETQALSEWPRPRKRLHVQPGPVPGLAWPNRCRHCDPAPCLQLCPTGAISRDGELNLVLIDESRCISCAMCAVVCPFDVVTFHPTIDGPGPDTQVAVKCDGCVDRLREGKEPACTEACKVDALVFGDLNELVAAGRLRQANVVFSATVTPLDGGDPLAGWRQWGRDAAQIDLGNGRVSGGRPVTARRTSGATGEGTEQ